LRAILPERKARREDNSQSYGSDPLRRSFSEAREATPRSGSMAATLRDQARFCKGFVSAGSSYSMDTPSSLRLALAEMNRDRGRNIFEIGS
jgi:hypothetical protein